MVLSKNFRIFSRVEGGLAVLHRPSGKALLINSDGTMQQIGLKNSLRD